MTPSRSIDREASGLDTCQPSFKQSSFPTCSDPAVFLSKNASEKTKRLWWLHGHPHSKRYLNPKLVTLGALVKHDAHVFRGQIAFIFPTSEEVASYTSLTWDRFHEITDVLASTYYKMLQSEIDDSRKSLVQPTVALLGCGTTLAYFATQIALQKLNLCVLLLADRSTADAAQSLLVRCHACALISDFKNSKTEISGIQKLLLVEDILDLKAKGTEFLPFEDGKDPWERSTFILHSSGTTGPPKAIVHTNRSMMLIARMYRLFPEYHIENWFLLFPMYHIAGISVVLSGLPNGLILSFPPNPWPLTSSALLSAWNRIAALGRSIDCVHCAPTFIENLYDHLSTRGADFTPLSSLRILAPGGAKLFNALVASLVSHGVNVKTTYGSTEIGPVFRTMPHTQENPHCYKFRNLYPDSDNIQLQDLGDGFYECILTKGFELAANLWDGKLDDEPYRTNDLFIEEPSGSGDFALYGRRDDLLVLSGGNNTSAGALELDIKSASPTVKNVLAVGHSRPCVGLIIELKDGNTSDIQEVPHELWENINAVNAKTSKHSKILRSMIHILLKGSGLPTTLKGNVKRNEALKAFTSIIDELYRSLEGVASQPNEITKSSSIPSRIVAVVSEFLGSSVDELKPLSSTSFHESNVHSISALRLRVLLSTRIGPISLGQLYEHFSIDSLVSFYQSEETVAKHENSFSYINRTIAKYSSVFSSWPKSSSPARTSSDSQQNDVVLLTGATGSLGTALLEKLVASPDVSRIYALVRGPKGLGRLKASLDSRKMNAERILVSQKAEVLNYTCQRSNQVIHCAWKVDFNLTVEDFESAMSLLRFCHAGKRKAFAYTSSVSACLGFSDDNEIPEAPIGDDPSIALRNGYAQSKFIMEKITQEASAKLDIPCSIFRVGQLCGHSQTNLWTQNDMYPIMFTTSYQLNALPTFFDAHVDWLPVDVAAGAVVEIITQPSSDLYSLRNIVNPNLVSWAELLTMLQASWVSKTGTRMEEVPMQEWTRRLRKMAMESTDAGKVPGLRLLQFFEDMAEGGYHSKIFRTEKSSTRSKTLRNCVPLQKEWLRWN